MLNLDKPIQVRGPNGEDDHLVKNINYGGFPLPNKHTGEYLRYLETAQQLGGTSAIIEAIAKTHYSLWGMQIHVEDALARDLLHCDMSGFKIQDIAFPAPSLEFYFEQSWLPTVIVVKGTMEEMLKQCKWEDAKVFDDGSNPGEEDSLNFYTESKIGVGMAFRARSHNWEKMISSSQEEIKNIGSAAFSEDEWLNLREVFALCTKVLAYANIPHYAPGPITRKQMKHGGKPGMKKRPARPAKRVIYMPVVKRDKKPTQNPTDTKRKFLGRRGHLKRLTSDYFVNKKGETIYVPPSFGPNGEIPKSVQKKTQVKVRYPRIHSQPEPLTKGK